MRTDSPGQRTTPPASILPARARSSWHPIYRRRFRAALLVLLSQHVFEHLSNGDQVRVERMADQINKRAHNDYPYMVRQRSVDADTGEDWRFVWRAWAMGSLGIPTGIAALTWEELSCGRRNPVYDFLAFRRFHRATDDAVNFLRQHSIDLDARAEHGRDWLEAMRHRYP